MGQLASWKSHKVVKAGKITMLPVIRDKKAIGPVVIEDANGSNCAVEVSASFFARGTPAVGDYLVIYEDDYKSWSPAKTFENGYTRV